MSRLRLGIFHGVLFHGPGSAANPIWSKARGFPVQPFHQPSSRSKARAELSETPMAWLDLLVVIIALLQQFGPWQGASPSIPDSVAAQDQVSAWKRWVCAKRARYSSASGAERPPSDWKTNFRASATSSGICLAFLEERGCRNRRRKRRQGSIRAW